MVRRKRCFRVASWWSLPATLLGSVALLGFAGGCSSGAIEGVPSEGQTPPGVNGLQGTPDPGGSVGGGSDTPSSVGQSQLPGPIGGSNPSGVPAGGDGSTAAGDADPATDAAAAPAAQAAPGGPAPVRGTDYVEIPGGQPFAPLDGQVEVVEVFAYSCGHCAAFDPLVNAWKQRLPADVRFTMLPGVFSDSDNFPKAFFAAEATGVLDRVHTPLFNALHTERRLRPNASTADIIAYMARHGADADQLKGTVDSFAVNAKIARTRQFIVRSGVDSTPTMIVNGKYRVRGRSLEDVLRITDQLVARERAAMQAGGTD